MNASLSKEGLKAFLHELNDQADLGSHLAKEFNHEANQWVEVCAGRTNDVGLPQALDQNAQMRCQAAMFTSVEGYLAAIGRISLILFPVSRRSSAIERAKRLKGALEIGDTHWLSDRRTRNDWMHFDERMDNLIARSPEVNLQRFAYLKSTQTVPDSQDLRIFFPERHEVWILGRRLNMIQELGKILAVHSCVEKALRAIKGRSI